MKNVMRIVGLVQGGTTPIDGLYLMEYDPGRDGTLGGQPITAHILCTPLKELAMKFDSLVELTETWKRTDPRNPTRPDGRPNRPLTAFTIESEACED
jgi:hypothetical protein